MKRPRKQRISVPDKPIKYYADYQKNWASLLHPLRQGRFSLESTDRLSITGDAPKDFVRIREFDPTVAMSRRPKPTAWIAKVGSKYYPNESFTEHLLTKIGQEMGVRVADSQVRMVGGQVRFLSRYFLTKTEILTHGIEIFRRHFDDATVQSIADQRREQEFYTFQTAVAAIEHVFPEELQTILGAFVEMLAFDAITGQNDRHPANWGVIVPVEQKGSIRFSPVFDSARALFWNSSEEKLKVLASNPQAFNAYLGRSRPQIGWNGTNGIDHFTLIRNVWDEYSTLRLHLEKFSNPDLVDICRNVIEGEFSDLMSDLRRKLIVRCIKERMARYCQSLGNR